ncbi:RING-box protein 1-like [Drosophila hydei]|uniref:RING-box protein 1-like n=1 Tax=Drosophila hydei TaxID=7224 RepID=A0A6J1MET0_DROHY|nr:RING-box protein 1-like [Drosophila hydei]
MKEIENIKKDANQKENKRFEIMNWNANALWAWDIQVDTCAICRNLIKDPCIECQSNRTDECPKAIGTCQHVYHFHCISRWLTKREVCPLDYRVWQYKN